MQYHHQPAGHEAPDPIDHLLVSELQAQARWRETLRQWEARKLRHRRARLLPVLSNIASVAALMALGFVLQALIPRTSLADNVAPGRILPAIENMLPADTTHAPATPAPPPAAGGSL